MTDQSQSPDDPRHLLADYLGDELSTGQRDAFEAALTRDADLAAEVESLREALAAMRALDAVDARESSRSTAPVATIKPASRRAHVVRIAALVALAFVGGYVLKGLEPTPTAAPGPTVAETNEVEPPKAAPSGSMGSRFAQHYLSGNDRRGFGRTLIAYARATSDEKRD